MRRHLGCIPSQMGSAAVEFALVASLFFMLMIGALEWGRILMQMSAAAEMTQLLTRSLALCDPGSVNVASKVQQFMPGFPQDLFQVRYQPTGCDASTCQWITVETNPVVPLEILNPFSSQWFTWPRLSSTGVRESMSSVVNGFPNSVCLS